MSVTTVRTAAETILLHGKLFSADCAGNIGWVWALLLASVLIAVPVVSDPAMLLVALDVVVVDSVVPVTRILLMRPGTFFILFGFRDF